ncbi:MAG TPA: UDP-3-O-(3-hydroxymyristoyl)glucosamine N-acyltransferase [Gemmatimonadales bacterium]
MPNRTLTAQAVAELVGGRLFGPGDIPIRRVRSLERAEADALSICAGRKYLSAMEGSRAGAVLIPDGLTDTPGPATRIVVPDPARAIAAVARALESSDVVAAGIAPTARIGRGCRLGEGSAIGGYSVVGCDVVIGARVRIGSHVVIEDGVVIGDDTRLDSHVVIYHGAILGARVWCKAAAVIGGVGFGYLSDESGHTRIPHVGGCILEDDVEIGSHSCVDRGSLDDTRIGRGTKIDNQVHIAHNVRTGRDCLIMACVGVAGSTTLGDRVILAGQSGCIDHITLGDDVRVGAKSAVMANVPAGTAVSGYPARPHREFLRGVATMYRLGPYGDLLEHLAKERGDA